MARPDLLNRLREAIALAQAGRRMEARRLLQQILAEDPRQVLAWIWLASVTADRAERIACLERALTLEPDNRTARQAYTQLTGRDYQPAPAPPAKSWQRALSSDAPIGLTSFLLILLVGAAAVVIIALVIGARDEERPARPARTVSPLAPVFYATATPLLSPTPSATRRPTLTPGPSPTSIWAAPPPTWTPVPTDTPAPTPTPFPTLTPTPSATRTPSPAPTDTFTPLPPTATRTPVPGGQAAAPGSSALLTGEDSLGA